MAAGCGNRGARCGRGSIERDPDRGVVRPQPLPGRCVLLSRDGEPFSVDGSAYIRRRHRDQRVPAAVDGTRRALHLALRSGTRARAADLRRLGAGAGLPAVRARRGASRLCRGTRKEESVGARLSGAVRVHAFPHVLHLPAGDGDDARHCTLRAGSLLVRHRSRARDGLRVGRAVSYPARRRRIHRRAAARMERLITTSWSSFARAVASVRSGFHSLRRYQSRKHRAYRAD